MSYASEVSDKGQGVALPTQQQKQDPPKTKELEEVLDPADLLGASPVVITPAASASPVQAFEVDLDEFDETVFTHLERQRKEEEAKEDWNQARNKKEEEVVSASEDGFESSEYEMPSEKGG